MNDISSINSNIDDPGDYASSTGVISPGCTMIGNLPASGSSSHKSELYWRIKNIDDWSQGIYLYADLPNLGHPAVFQLQEWSRCTTIKPLLFWF